MTASAVAADPDHAVGPDYADILSHARETAVPLHDHELVIQLAEYWHRSLRPLTNFDNYLLQQVAVCSVRMDRCQIHEQTLRERTAARAAACWDEDRALAAEVLALKLAAEPAVVRLKLRQSPQGCRWLILRWEMLVGVLRGGGEWTESQKILALDLLGTAAELRGGGPPALAAAEAELESLRARAALLDPLDAADRGRVECGLTSEPDRMMTMVRQWEAAASRQFRWALKQLKIPHQLLASPPPDYRRHPTTVPPAPSPVRGPRARDEADGGLGERPSTGRVAGPIPAPRGREGSPPPGS